jgi:hypothetical protein
VVIRKVDAPPTADVALESVRADDRSITVTLTGAPAEISFVGDDGHVRQRTNGLSASYAFTASDTYIRTNVQTPKMLLFLNPVMRSDTDNHRPVMPAVEEDGLLTWPTRGIVLIACAVTAYLLVV